MNRKKGSTFSYVEIERTLANTVRKLRRVCLTCFCILSAVVNILSFVGKPYLMQSFWVLSTLNTLRYVLTFSVPSHVSLSRFPSLVILV
jgi:hypothetical protein